MQLTADPARLERSEQHIADSTLVKIPLLEQRDSRGGAWAPHLKAKVLGALLPTIGLNARAMRHLSRWRTVPRRTGCALDAGSTAAELVRDFKIDIVVLHASGGADASEIIDVATAAGIPAAIIHHFANGWLGGASVRQQVSRVDAVAGASAVAVPRYLRDTFFNLSDGVDTDFYSRDSAHAPQREFATPVIYAPGRLTPEKGQVAVIEVAHRLKQRGLSTTVLFAGRAEVPDFESHLRRLAAERGLSDSVVFLGPLSLEHYRDWYHPATVMLMPTDHSEGMPRTLIESQSMEVPPVVYDIGGTSEGVRHGETGYVVKQGDVDRMAGVVETLLRAPDLRRTMGASARRFVVESFSLAALAERHEKFYAHILEQRRKR